MSGAANTKFARLAPLLRGCQKEWPMRKSVPASSRIQLGMLPAAESCHPSIDQRRSMTVQIGRVMLYDLGPRGTGDRRR